MAKTKRRHLAAIAAKKDTLPMDNKQKCSPLPSQETELPDEGGSWVEVRKQRVIILIPPLPKVTQASPNVERMKRTEAALRPSTKGVRPISRKRSRIDSNSDAKNASGNIRKVILKMKSRQEERMPGGKTTDPEVSQNILPVQLPEPESACAQKPVAQGTSKLGTHSTTDEIEVPKPDEREPMPMPDGNCQTVSTDNLQIPPRKVSKAFEKKQNSAERVVHNKLQRRETLMDNATKLELEEQGKPKEKGRMGNQLPPVEDAALFSLQRHHQNSKETEAVRSSDLYPPAAANYAHLSPALHVESNSSLLDCLKLQQTFSTGFDCAKVGPSICPSNKFLEQPCIGHNPMCTLSLQHANVSLVSSTSVASEKISSVSIHMKANEVNTNCTNANREINIFGSTNCIDTAALESQTKRALTLGRKLEEAGGLSRWLVSQGLGQFVEIFQREKIKEFQLLQLTMGTLKEMGAHAVGPRRKLIHAIDQLSRPYYFEAF
eukprot:Gb_01244 [translate_table: standard]